MKLLFSVLLIAVLPLAYEAAPNCQKAKYDFYVLTMTWPSTFCQMTKSCKPSMTHNGKDFRPAAETKFTVHGLWPNVNGAKSPEYCCKGDKIDPNVSKIGGLKEMWPAMKDDNFEGFWSYEYNKHGTCAQDMKHDGSLSMKYFQETARLVKELNLDQALVDAGYGAHDDKNLTGPSMELLKTLEQRYKKKPKIRCAEIDGKKAALEQIQFCYDKDLKMIDCEFPNMMCRPNMVVPSYKAASGLTFKEKGKKN